MTVVHAWEFFASPRNLALITPPEMRLKVLTKLDEGPIHDGMCINYTVCPIGPIPLRWQTEICKNIPLSEFMDRQVKGPYLKWEHHHRFTPFNNGTMMADEVIYQLPFGPLGDMVHKLFVRKKIEAIFRYRKETLLNLFPDV